MEAKKEMAPKAEEEGAESSSSEANGPAAAGEGSDAIGGASEPGWFPAASGLVCRFSLGQ